MPEKRSSQNSIRQREFGAFLRSRREKMTPSDAGLSNGFRRRTPGLRREEVAFLAGVGTTWYTWLEQGRDVNPSVDVLNALADALKLDLAEKRHLFTLADRVPPALNVAALEEVPDSLVHMIEYMADQPAYVLGRRWDVLAWNAAAVSVFGDFARLEGDERNLIHMMFAHNEHRSLLADWDTLAPVSLAMFRADSANYAGDPDFERLIVRLLSESEEFRDWWPRQDVALQPSTVKRISHPSKGPLIFEYLALEVSGCPGMRVVVCTPKEK